MKLGTSVMALASISWASSAQGTPLRTLIYRGPQSCGYDPNGDQYGCAEEAADLLMTSTAKVDVTYAGPNEDTQIDANTLSNYDIYVQPGGGDLAPAWNELGKNADAIRDFVTNGGIYIGICLGAYLAGPQSGYNLLPDGWTIDREVKQDNAQISNTSDTVIQVDWRYTVGPKAGTTAKGQWLYFQDGAVVIPGNAGSVQILGNYTSSGDIAASLSPLGSGWVGIIGPHPEAPKEWYSDPDLPQPFTNPDGYQHDVGHGFVEAVINAGSSSKEAKNKTTSTSSSSPTKSASASPSANAGNGLRVTGLSLFMAAVSGAGLAFGII